MVLSGDEQGRPDVTENGRRTWYVVGLLILFLFAWALLLFRLNEVPPGFQHDQTFASVDALEVSGGHFSIYFPANFGRDPLFIYSAAGLFRVTGGHFVWSLRFTSVLWGMLGLATTLAFARRYLSHGAALAAVTLMATSFWYLMAARLGLEPIALLPLAIGFLYLLNRGLARVSLFSFVAAGLAGGIAIYVYLASRTLFLLIPLLMIYEAVAWVRSRRSVFGLSHEHAMRLAGLLLALAVMLAVSAPFLIYLAGHSEVADGRVRELGGPIASAEHGDLRPILTNALDTVRSILWSGSRALPYHYNIPGRAALPPILSVFFLVGLIATLARVRERREYLLVAALLLGLAPSLLTSADALYMRAIYVLPLLLIVTARGLWVAASLIDRWSSASWAGGLYRRSLSARLGLLKALAGVLLAGLLLWQAVDSGMAYFVRWADAEQTQRIYNADFRAAARYLDANPTNDEVFIGTDRLIDLDQSTYRFYEPARPDVNWFTLPQGPALPRDGNALYLLPAQAEVPASLRLVSEQPRPAAVAGSGPGQFWLSGPGDQYEIVRGLRISAEDVQRALDGAGVRSPDSSVSFGDAIRLDGIGLRDDSSPPQTGRRVQAELITRWTVLAPWPRSARPGYPFPQPKLAVSFTDPGGYKWAQSDLVTSLPVQTWRPGQMLVEVTPVAFPADILPGDYAVQLAMYDDEGGLMPMRDGSGNLLASPPTIGNLHVAQGQSGYAPSPPFAVHQVSGEQTLRLLGRWESLDKIIAGVPALVHASWQAVKPLDTAGLRFGLRAKSAAGDLLWEQPADPLIPLPAHWPAGQVYRLAYNLLPQSISSGVTAAELELCAYREQIPLACGILGQPAVLTRSPLLELPHLPQQKSGADFGDSLSLVGYDVMKSGETITLTLYWQAEAPPAVPVKRFVHATDANGQIVAQSDVPVDSLAEGVPEIYWRPGEYVIDRLALEIPTDKQVANLLVGLYDAGSGERLPVRMPNGDPLPDRRLTIPYQEEVQR